MPGSASAGNDRVSRLTIAPAMRYVLGLYRAVAASASFGSGFDDIWRQTTTGSAAIA